jgi:hypothetical protein
MEGEKTMTNAAGKVMWIGRATVFMVGLAVIVGLVMGLASTALAASGENFIIGNGLSDTVMNIATLPTKLTMQGTESGPALQVTQQSNNAGASGVGVTVPTGKAPLTVNSTAGKATNLNADRIDGKDSTEFSPTRHEHDSRYYTEPESNGRFVDEIDHTKAAHDTLNIDADTLDGMNSTKFAAANEVKVGRLKLPVPADTGVVTEVVTEQNVGTVFETSAFKIQATCIRRSIPPDPNRESSEDILSAELRLVAKQGGSAITYQPEPPEGGGPYLQTPAAGEATSPIASTHWDPERQPAILGILHSYANYSADAPSGFLNGDVSLVIEPDTNSCRFSATGLGK